MADPSPQATPKRKRGEQLPTTPIKFSFDLATAGPPEDGSNSPRSNVAHRFRGLALGGGGGDASESTNEAADSMRKRHRPDEDMKDLGVVGPEAAPVMADREREPCPASTPPLVRPDVAIVSTEAVDDSPGSTMPVVDPQQEPTPTRRKRAGTPPLRLKSSPDKDSGHDPSVVDPVRAALTWHEDEITVYDPDDEDDDGTGINGVGFKPTPALAHARAMKRRQQMAEYRRREESEARAKRSQRRRAGTPTPAASGGVAKKKSPMRRVRFIDAENRKIAVTTI